MSHIDDTAEIITDPTAIDCGCSGGCGRMPDEMVITGTAGCAPLCIHCYTRAVREDERRQSAATPPPGTVAAHSRWFAIPEHQQRSRIGQIVDQLADVRHELSAEDIEAAEALIELAKGAPTPLDRAVARHGIYIASKSKHGPRWRALRESGVPIVSTWIDESGEGETSDWPGLWDRCISEASTCAAMIVYVEEHEIHKGSLVEVGAALHAGVPVFWVGPEYSTAPRHRNVRRVATVDVALAALACDAPATEEPG